MSRSRTIRWALLIVAIAGLGYLGWQRFQSEGRQAQADTQKRVPARAAVPVRITPVEKADFPVYLTGLGTVQGFNTVVVRTRVDGQINRIAFQEGQFVKEGDTLVEIDPRPFQAALDQAKAKKAQTKPTSPTPASTCSASPSSANSRPGNRPIRNAPPSRS